MTTNTVSFPTANPSTRSHIHPDPSEAGSFPHTTRALDVFDALYGFTCPSWEAIERFYEASAIYENPLVTATSRSLISDIHCLASQLVEVNIPKPVAVVLTVFGMQRHGKWRDPWFQAIRIWTEVGDVCESDSFDGHRKAIIEHTLHILLLPGLHPASSQPSNVNVHPTAPHSAASSEISVNQYYARQSMNSSVYSTLGLDLSIPSPFHLRLPIMTRLLFNDAGRITHHRDFWDVKDLLGLVPGMTLTQWITGRLFAQGIRGVVGIGRSLFGHRGASSIVSNPIVDEEALTPAEAYAKSIKSGKQGSQRRQSQTGWSS